MDNFSVKQYARLGVRTKNGKSAKTYLWNIPELVAIVRDWDCFIRDTMPNHAAWYSIINNQWGEQSLIDKEPGKNRQTLLNRRLKRLCHLAGIEYKSAHKFRHGHAVYGLKNVDKFSQYKALSMNMMHANILVTDSVYAEFSPEELGKQITSITQTQNRKEEIEILKALGISSKEELAEVFLKVLSEKGE